MALDIKRVPHEAAQVFFDWSCLAIYGEVQKADDLFRKKRELVREAARLTLYNIGQQMPLPKKLYRGVLLKQPNFVRLAPDGRPWLSFSDDPHVAHSFADFENGFNATGEPVVDPETGRVFSVKEWTRFRLGEHGYVIEHQPDYQRDVLFHWSLLVHLPYVKSLGEDCLSHRLKQREVIIDPMGRSFPVVPISRWAPLTIQMGGGHGE